MSSDEILESNCPIEPACLLEKAEKAGLYEQSAATTGNIIVIYTMFILQRILTCKTNENPIQNLTDILAIATVISNLNTSIHTNLP